MSKPTLDEIGQWSEIKLAIIGAYAKSYSQILAKQPRLYHIYIDGFAGAGLHVSKQTQQRVGGSPLNVASVRPAFREYHLVELNSRKADHLRSVFADNPDVRVYHDDCNEIAPNQLLPSVQYNQYRRALCLLDPYALHLDWKVTLAAGQQKTIDLLLNFPIMDMNMNVLRHDSTSVTAEQRARMTRYWGDESWKDVAYSSEPGLFGPIQEKTENENVVQAFAKRLQHHAGFKYVAEPLPMRNSKQSIVYYLFFATQNQIAHKIITYIFDKYRSGGGGADGDKLLDRMD